MTMSDSDEDFNEIKIKIVVLGDSNTGKSNIIKRFCYDEFSRIYVPTIGADFHIRRIKTSIYHEITIRLSDISGSEISGDMLRTYLFQANVVILVYDITNEESFLNMIPLFKTILETSEGKLDGSRLYVALFGNKCDLEHRRSVKFESIKQFVNETKLSNFFVSAKTGENVYSSLSEVIAKNFNMPLNTLRKDKDMIKPITNFQQTIKIQDKKRHNLMQQKPKKEMHQERSQPNCLTQ